MAKPPRSGSATGVIGRGAGKLVQPPLQAFPQPIPAPVTGKPAAVGVLDDLYSGDRDNKTKRDWNDANIEVYHSPTVHVRAAELFGRALTDSEWGRLVGAPDDAQVTVSLRRNGGLGIEVEHPWYDSQSRSISRGSDGVLRIHNDIYELSDAGKLVKGVGTRVFSYQAEAARRLGVKEIETDAAKGYGFVGYNAWARTGYNSPIDADVLAQLPASLKRMRIRTLNDLFMAHGSRVRRNPGDRLVPDFWREKGHEFSGTFSLDPQSASWRVNRAYREESGINLGF